MGSSAARPQHQSTTTRSVLPLPHPAILPLPHLTTLQLPDQSPNQTSSSCACMAKGRRIRPRSRCMRRGGQMPGASGAVIKQHGGGKHGGRVFRGRAGDASLAVVDSCGADSKIQQPSNADSDSDDCIYVRGHRIQKAGLRLHIDSNGDVYVPDSEEESSTEEAEACGLDVAAGMDHAVDLTPPVPMSVGVELVPEGDAFVDVGGQVPDVAADHSSHEDLTMKGPPVVATNKDVPPEVPEQLKEVVANLDPVYHDVFSTGNRPTNSAGRPRLLQADRGRQGRRRQPHEPAPTPW